VRLPIKARLLQKKMLSIIENIFIDVGAVDVLVLRKIEKKRLNFLGNFQWDIWYMINVHELSKVIDTKGYLKLI